MRLVYDAAQAAMQKIVDDINAGKYAKLAGGTAEIKSDKRGIVFKLASGYHASVAISFIAHNPIDHVINRLADGIDLAIKDDVAR